MKIYKCRRCKEGFESTNNQRVCDYCRGRCSTCDVVLTEENQDHTSKFKRNNYVCKKCVAATVKRTRGNKGFCQKEYDYQRYYGISKEEYAEMYSDQKGECLICNTYKETLCVDHCHTTLKVRGLLCTNCNTALGFLKDDVKILEKAISYLNDSSS